MLPINIEKLKGAYSNLGGVLDVKIRDNSYFLTIQDLETKKITEVDGNKAENLFFSSVRKN